MSRSIAQNVRDKRIDQTRSTAFNVRSTGVAPVTTTPRLSNCGTRF